MRTTAARVEARRVVLPSGGAWRWWSGAGGVSESEATGRLSVWREGSLSDAGPGGRPSVIQARLAVTKLVPMRHSSSTV